MYASANPATRRVQNITAIVLLSLLGVAIIAFVIFVLWTFRNYSQELQESQERNAIRASHYPLSSTSRNATEEAELEEGRMGMNGRVA